MEYARVRSKNGRLDLKALNLPRKAKRILDVLVDVEYEYNDPAMRSLSARHSEKYFLRKHRSWPMI